MTNDPVMEKWFGDNWYEIVMKAGNESCRDQMRLIEQAKKLEKEEQYLIIKV